MVFKVKKKLETPYVNSLLAILTVLYMNKFKNIKVISLALS